MNKFYIIYITLLFIDYIQLLKNDNGLNITDTNYELNYSFTQNGSFEAFNSKYYSFINLKKLTNFSYQFCNSNQLFTYGTVNISTSNIIDYHNSYNINFIFNNDSKNITITPNNSIFNNKIKIEDNFIFFDKNCSNKLNQTNCKNNYCLKIESNEVNIFRLYIICHLFEYGGIYGVLIIPIGLFISLYGSIHHIITSVFYGMFFLFSLIQFISEELNIELNNDFYIVELIISGIIPGFILGFYLSHPDTKTIEFKREKIFFGSFLGMIIWNSFLYYIFIPLISSKELTIKIMRYITIIPMIIFSYLFYKIKKNKIIFLINTIIIGSYLVIYGLNLILGGFYYNRIQFINDFKFYDMKNPSLFMYLILNILLIISSFFYQINLRSKINKGKKKQKNIQKIKSEYPLDKSSSTLYDLDEENLSNEEENEVIEKDEEEYDENNNNNSYENLN